MDKRSVICITMK